MRRLLMTAWLAAWLTTGLCVGGLAHAGRSCEQRAADPRDVASAMALAAATAQALDADGATVVPLARAGQDLHKYGLRYSHLGFAYRDTADGQPVWRILHKLNQCGTAQSALYRQGLGEFFLDKPHRYDAAFVALSPELQAQLAPLLKDNTRVAALHEPRYSMVAYAWGQTYQQSNQWLLETLALASEPAITGRQQAQAWLQFKAYAPTTLHLGPLSRLGARVTAANVAFDDHPSDLRFSDRIQTVTVDSVFAWLQRSGLGAAPVLVRGDTP